MADPDVSKGPLSDHRLFTSWVCEPHRLRPVIVPDGRVTGHAPMGLTPPARSQAASLQPMPFALIARETTSGRPPRRTRSPPTRIRPRAFSPSWGGDGGLCARIIGKSQGIFSIKEILPSILPLVGRVGARQRDGVGGARGWSGARPGRGDGLSPLLSLRVAVAVDARRARGMRRRRGLPRLAPRPAPQG